MGVGIFSDCVFFLKINSLPLKEKKQLKKCIISNGGSVSFVLNAMCTHAVVVSAAVLNSSQQKRIQKHSIQIVRPEFIQKSIQENRLVESELADDTPSDVPRSKIIDKKQLFLEKFLRQTPDSGEKDFDHDEIEEEGDEDEKDLPPDAEVAKYSFFRKEEEIAVVEIICLNDQHPAPYKISTTCGTPGFFQREFTFNLAHVAEKACEKYGQRINDLKNKGFIQVDKIPPEAEYFASQALQKVLLGEALNVLQLSQEVGGFVESIWVEAQGHLTSTLSCRVSAISLNDISKAEGILQHIRNILNKNRESENIGQMLVEFYQCIPHRRRIMNGIDKKFLTAKQDLCQLIRDMLNVCETNSSRSFPSSVAKYRALRCRIEHVEPDTEEFQRVRQEVLAKNYSNEDFYILKVLRIGRLSEAINFKSDVGNIKSFLHASSPCNFVGILSRGLQLPKMIVDEFGLDRTDIGNLGSGIYFSDSISTCVKYTKTCNSTGARLLLVCDVALGNTEVVTKRDYSITGPPEGFHSIHGMRRDALDSDFTDDEYVVYDVNQVKIRYVVQFCTCQDTPKPHRELTLTLQEENETEACEPLEDFSVEDLPEPEIKKGGLQDMNGEKIPLESIHVRAHLKDLAAQVVIFQTYKNFSLSPIEAKYVFPLDGTAAVCGFEAFINGKHIVGEVKEKQEAHREYREAISEGHGAYLMDQDSPDVFTVSVGNLPAGATAVIKITYVTELSCEGSTISFSIPASVASWQEDQALKENTQDIVSKVGIDSSKAAQGSFSLELSIEMPQKINSLWSNSHKLKIKRTECKAVIQVQEGSSLTDEGFSLTIQLDREPMPRMWVETHPDQGSEACMLIFQPQFEYFQEEPIVTICLDCSNSMESCFQSAKRVALLALRLLSHWTINIITFGSYYKEFYFYPKKQPDKVTEMETFIKAAKPNMGSTEFWKPLQSMCLLRSDPSSGHQKVLLISDGHLQNDDMVFQILKEHKGHIKVFTCGVGSKANKHMLRRLANDGSGAFEYFADASKSSWKSQMDHQLVRLQSPVCSAVSIKWRQFERNPPTPVQAPANIQTLFYSDKLLVYGFISNCTQATLKALINNKVFENFVATTELQKTRGTILHKLTARALIRDYEDGILREKEQENELEKQKMKSFIIKLSKENSIVSQFTSFVAVEKRSEGESENIEPDIDAILSAEQVDILPYMEFTEEEAEYLIGCCMDSDSEGTVKDANQNSSPTYYAESFLLPPSGTPSPPANLLAPQPSYMLLISAPRIDSEALLQSCDLPPASSFSCQLAPKPSFMRSLRSSILPPRIDSETSLQPHRSGSAYLLAPKPSYTSSLYSDSLIVPRVISHPTYSPTSPDFQEQLVSSCRSLIKEPGLDTAPPRSKLADLGWSTFSLIQCEAGNWELDFLFGQMFKVDVYYLCDIFLAQRGISSLGSRGKEEVFKLIATLLVLQAVRHYKLLPALKFKSLMKLEEECLSECCPRLVKAMKWVVKTDRQYPGICYRLGLGRDWDHATRQLLNIEPPSADLEKALLV